MKVNMQLMTHKNASILCVCSQEEKALRSKKDQRKQPEGGGP